jgi:hypothetical protein
MGSNPNVISKQNKTLNFPKKNRLGLKKKRLKISKESRLFVAYVSSHTLPDITFCSVNAQKIKILEYARTVLSSIGNKNIKEFIFKVVHL